MVRLKSKSNRLKNVLSVILIMILVSSMVIPVIDADKNSDFEEKVMSENGHTEIEPIRVNGNNDFNESVWDGNGTEDNPYVLDNYSIDGGGYGYCVYVGNVSDSYFLIENCIFHNATGGSGNDYYPNSGLVLFYSENGLIADNNISNNQNSGLYLSYSYSGPDPTGHKICSNYISENQNGITLTNNSKGNLVENNSIEENDLTGIKLEGSDNNKIIYNTIKGNINGTLFKSYPDRNVFHHNNFINDVNINDSEIGNNTWANGTHGNFWSDYEGTDSDEDGIGDESYVIDSSNKDNYPLMNPLDEQEPEIKDVKAAPNTQNLDSNVNISCTLEDLMVDEVWLNITNPDDSYQNLSMLQGENNEWYLNQTYHDLGTYKFVIGANDTNDNSNTTSIFEFTMIDETQPQIIDNTISAPNTGEKYLINASITDNYKVKSAEVYYELNSTEGYFSNNTTKMDEDYTRNIKIWKNATEFSYKIIANDTSGNENYTVLKTLNVNDTLAPKIKNVNIQPEKQLQDKSVNITAEISDNIELKNASVNFTKTIGKQVDMQTKNDEYYYNTTYSENGTYSLKIKAVDEDGNKKVSSKYSFEIGDYISPNITILNPSNDKVITKSNTTIEWWGKDSESSIMNYSIKINNKEWINIGLNESYEFIGLEDGEKNVTIKATDQYNNTSTDKVTFIIDTYAPKLNIKYPENNAILSKKDITVKWSSTDNGSGVSEFYVNIDESGWNSRGNNTTYNALFTNGDHNMKIKSMDNAGFSRIEEINFTVDTTAPSVEFVNIDNNTIFNKSEISIQWSGEEQITSIKNYRLIIDGSKKENFDLNTTYNKSFSEGNHSLKVIAEDKAGNIGYSTIHFTVDISKPEVNIISPTEENITLSNVTIEWDGHDNITGIQNYSIKINNKTWINMGKKTSYIIDEEGIYNISIKALDHCEHTTIKSFSFTLKSIDLDIDVELNDGEKWILQQSIPIDIISKGQDHPSDMRMALNSEFTEESTGWIEYNKNYDYTVPEKSAEYTIYFEFKDDGEYISLNKTINVDLTKPTGTANISNNITSEAKVNISLTAQDDIDEIKKVIIAENENFTSATTKSYSNNVEYQLSNGYGEKTIFLKYITEHGQESDIEELFIFLDNKGPELTYKGDDEITKQENLNYNIIWNTEDYSSINQYEIYKIVDDQKELINDDIQSKEYQYTLKDNKTYDFKLTAIDEYGNSNSITFSIVTDINYPPKIDSVDIPNEINPEDILKVDVSDPNKDDLTITWYDGDKEIGKGEEIKPNLKEGEHDIKVVISDGTNKKEKSFDVDVKKSSKDDPIFTYLLIAGILLTLIIGGVIYMMKRNKPGSNEDESFEEQEEVEAEIFEEEQSEESTDETEDIDEDDVDLFGV